VLAFKRAFRADPMVGILGDESKAGTRGEVNLWADSVGDAVGQLGLVLTVAIVARFVCGLLSDLAIALQ
jgi:hypothetical protein